MSSLSRDLIDAALAADLSKNEYKVFLALFRQTLCYGKASDPLTLKRLAKLTGIRKDRLAHAVQGVIAVGLFNATEHKLFDTLYSISNLVLKDSSVPLFAPHLLSNRMDLPPAEAPPDPQVERPETRVHTTNYLTPFTTTSLTAPLTSTATQTRETMVGVSREAEGLPYPESFTPTERQRAAHCLDGLPPELARDCLQLLHMGLQAGRVKSPLAYLHHLSKAARAGRLDRSGLEPTHSTLLPATSIQRPASADQGYRLQILAADIQALDRLQMLAGLPLDPTTQAHRQALVKEFNGLKATLGEISP